MSSVVEQAFSWTEDNIATLRAMWGRGETSGAIAAHFSEHVGLGVTRSAVIGKVHRLGLKRDPGPSPQAKSPTTAKPETVRATAQPKLQATPPKRTLREVPLPAPRDGVGIADLRPGHCRWIVAGERKHARYCGAGKADPAKPYCAAHAKRAYAGTTTREERQVEAALRARGMRP